MTDFDAALGKRIARLREELGMSQTDVAKHMKASGHPWWQQTVQRVESGVRPVRLSELAALSAALFVGTQVLLSTEPRAREWPRSARKCPDESEVRDYLGRRWTQVSPDQWESDDGEFVVPFAFLAEQWGPLREVTS